VASTLFALFVTGHRQIRGRNASPLAELSESLQQLSSRISSSVVQITATGYGLDSAQGTGTNVLSRERSTGSGVVPTVTLNYPSNIPGGPGHNWANGVSMATPIAHKGVIAGAKVQAKTVLDILLHPELVQKAWDYYNNVQTKGMKYQPLLRPGDKPAIWLNQKTMEEYRPKMKAFYYDPSKYDTYLDQLGIKYPTVRK
jgi:aminobenzoyl-glutamate utilization protein B